MLQGMSASQFASWAAYFRSLSGVSKDQRYMGSGKMRVRDWRQMNEAERQKAKKQLYGMFRNYAVASGGLHPGGGKKRG